MFSPPGCHTVRGVPTNTQDQILRVVELEKADDVKRPYIKQLTTKNLTFPLPHRVPRISNKKIFSATRPSTFA